jgi:hypothetical protein
MNNKYIGAAVLVAALLGYGVGKYTSKPVLVKAETEKIKEKETSKNVKKVITKTKDKDGNEKTVTVIDSSTDTKSKQNEQTKLQFEKSKRYKAGLVLTYDKEERLSKGIAVGTQLIGPIDLLLYGTENKQFGAIITFEF